MYIIFDIVTRCYLSGDLCYPFTKDTSKAIRFDSMKEALDYMDANGWSTRDCIPRPIF